MKLLSCTFLICLTTAMPAHAQVIEIDATGQAQTYDGPTLFTLSEPVPIQPQPSVSQTLVNASVLLADAARTHGLEPGLLEAMAWQESRGRMAAVSPKGALGVMQLMPTTAAELGVEPRDISDNIRGGALYFRRQLDRFGSVPLALAAYNAGPGAVQRYGGIPPFRETQNYVARIMARWRPTIAAH